MQTARSISRPLAKFGKTFSNVTNSKRVALGFQRFCRFSSALNIHYGGKYTVFFCLRSTVTHEAQNEFISVNQTVSFGPIQSNDVDFGVTATM